MARKFTYSKEVPTRTPIEGTDYILERIFLPEYHLPLGYDTHNPNHGWRTATGGPMGNDWIRVVAAHEIEEVAG